MLSICQFLATAAAVSLSSSFLCVSLCAAVTSWISYTDVFFHLKLVPFGLCFHSSCDEWFPELFGGFQCSNEIDGTVAHSGDHSGSSWIVPQSNIETASISWETEQNRTFIAEGETLMKQNHLKHRINCLDKLTFTQNASVLWKWVLHMATTQNLMSETSLLF